MGTRNLQAITAQLRMKFSDLKYDLFQINPVDNPVCSCGVSEETSSHYFFECRLYENERHILFDTLYDILAEIDVDFTVDVLLSGSTTLPFVTNKQIIYAVHTYIISTNRFN